jgi:hypothetical protein
MFDCVKKTQYTFIPFYLFPIPCDALSFDYFGYAQDRLSTSAPKSSEVEIQLPLIVKPAA